MTRLRKWLTLQCHAGAWSYLLCLVASTGANIGLAWLVLTFLPPQWPVDWIAAGSIVSICVLEAWLFTYYGEIA
jgi:hypothetical protein